MRKTTTLAAIAIAALTLPFAASAQSIAQKTEGGTEGSGMKQSVEQPQRVKKTPEQKAAAKADRKQVRTTAQGGAPMTDGSTLKQTQEQPPKAKKAAETKKTPETK